MKHNTIFTTVLLGILCLFVAGLFVGINRNVDIAPGQVWAYYQNLDNPFEDAKCFTMIVLDVKDNYVKYLNLDTYGILTERVETFPIDSQFGESCLNLSLLDISEQDIEENL